MSDDEIREHWDRAIAEAEVMLMMALAPLAVATERATAAYVALSKTINAHVEASVDALTREEREIYYALVACGTPSLDALVELDDLRKEAR